MELNMIEKDFTNQLKANFYRAVTLTCSLDELIFVQRFFRQ